MHNEQLKYTKNVLDGITLIVDVCHQLFRILCTTCLYAGYQHKITSVFIKRSISSDIVWQYRFTNHFCQFFEGRRYFRYIFLLQIYAPLHNVEETHYTHYMSMVTW